MLLRRRPSGVVAAELGSSAWSWALPGSTDSSVMVTLVRSLGRACPALEVSPTSLQAREVAVTSGAALVHDAVSSPPTEEPVLKRLLARWIPLPDLWEEGLVTSPDDDFWLVWRLE
jgi:hypothetical protein